jgi:hypothetical protein
MVEEEEEKEFSSNLNILIEGRKFAAAIKFLDTCTNDEANKQLTKKLGKYYETNSLFLATIRAAPENLIRALVRRGPQNYINFKNVMGYSVAAHAAWFENLSTLELLLTLGADPKQCRERALYYRKSDATLAILDRFDQRTALACCLRRYDDIHLSSPLVLHPAIKALEPFARILHDLHGINGESHDFSRKILSYI